MRTGAIILGVAVAMLAALPARAHHAFATEFDVNRPVEFSGKVVKVAEPPKRSGGVKVADAKELVAILKTEAGVL